MWGLGHIVLNVHSWYHKQNLDLQQATKQQRQMHNQPYNNQPADMLPHVSSLSTYMSVLSHIGRDNTPHHVKRGWQKT